MTLTPMRKRLLRIYGWCLALGTVYLVWLLLTGIRIPCPFYELTGLPCPGCGTTRMFLALFRLDLPAAFAYNPPMFLAFFLWNAVALALWLEKPRFCSRPRFLCTLVILTSVSILVWGTVRLFL